MRRHDDVSERRGSPLYSQRAGPIHIDATYEGRFDAAFAWRDHKGIKLGQGNVNEEGYGKKHDYDGRIVLHQLSDVRSKPLPRK